METEEKTTVKVKYNFDLLKVLIERDKCNIDLEQYKNAKLNKNCKIDGICNCNNPFSKTLGCAYLNGGAFCITCKNKNMREKQRKTLQKNHGVDNPMQVKGAKERAKENFKKTCIKLYGVDNHMKLKDFQEKSRKGMLEKYKVEYPMQNKKIRQKANVACKLRYGFNNPLQNLKIYEKSKQTLFKNYKTTHPMKVKELRDKISQTYKNLSKLSLQKRRQSYIETCIKRYGHSSHMHNPEIINKIFKSSFLRKEIVKSDGDSISLQGFEPQAYKILLKTYNEDEIITNDKLKPEIKSSWTYKLNKEKIRETKLMCNFLNYNFELWILNEKGDILEKHI
jgi:hypothetical protein